MCTRPVVHIIDDDPAIRDSLAFLLDVNGYDAAVHESATAFLALLVNPRLDCIISGVRMPGMSGIDLVGELRANSIDCPVIIMTGHGDIALAVEAIKAGVVDFIEKPFDDEALLGAIQRALDTRSATTMTEVASADASARMERLSSQELDVLAELIKGHNNKGISQHLAISQRGVEAHRANIMTKTGARSLSELVRMALAAGL